MACTSCDVEYLGLLLHELLLARGREHHAFQAGLLPFVAERLRHEPLLVAGLGIRASKLRHAPRRPAAHRGKVPVPPQAPNLVPQTVLLLVEVRIVNFERDRGDGHLWRGAGAGTREEPLLACQPCSLILNGTDCHFP